MARLLRQTDRQTDPKGNRIPQAIKMGLSTQVKPRLTNIAGALCARDYKGPSNLGMTTMVKYEK